LIAAWRARFLLRTQDAATQTANRAHPKCYVPDFAPPIADHDMREMAGLGLLRGAAVPISWNRHLDRAMPPRRHIITARSSFSTRISAPR
jgi:hypothetical protein